MDRHNCTDTISGAALSSALSLSWHGWLNDGKRLIVREFNRVPAAIVTTVRMWRRRNCARNSIRTMDEHMLRDIGLSPEQARLETQKPFWRP
ncbi:DUF1127 domain-containing protein [Magnetovibrio sp.]|uniref:DUF1127 domain-containing protein n=1 Tax=Magnetovibrio sp. TaxID=2024836 RepID=UPI002F958FFC